MLPGIKPEHHIAEPLQMPKHLWDETESLAHFTGGIFTGVLE